MQVYDSNQLECTIEVSLYLLMEELSFCIFIHPVVVFIKRHSFSIFLVYMNYR